MEFDRDFFKIKTAHNEFGLWRQGELLELRGSDKSLQSVIDLRHPGRLCLKNLEYLMGVQLFVPRPRRILVLGTAGGSILHFLQAQLRDSRITSVDIDTELVRRLLEMEILPAGGHGLSYIGGDAADYIRDCKQTFDLILIDLFNGAHSPPWLFGKDTSEKLHRLLGERGALAYNLIVASESTFARFYRDLRLVFADRTLCLPAPGLENKLVYAFHDTMPARDMNWYRQRAIELGESQGVDYLQILATIYNTNPVGAGVL